jgi:hypothetical protein
MDQTPPTQPAIERNLKRISQTTQIAEGLKEGFAAASRRGNSLATIMELAMGVVIVSLKGQYNQEQRLARIEERLGLDPDGCGEAPPVAKLTGLHL